MDHINNAHLTGHRVFKYRIIYNSQQTYHKTNVSVHFVYYFMTLIAQCEERIHRIISKSTQQTI